jgi:hypothetical protein
MVPKYTALAWLLLIAGLPLAAQTREQPPRQQPAVKLEAGETAVPGECLTKEELDLNSALRALSRPTFGVEAGPNADDPLRFNPNYFVGKWTIEGVLPESPLGPAGDITGTETFRHVTGCTYEASLQGKVGGAAFTVKSLMVYDRRSNYLVKDEQDSRGFRLLKMGIVGGDAGGYTSHHWEAPEFTYKGRRIRLQGSTFLASPDNQRLRMQMSVDGQPVTAYGTLWWTREGAKK